MVKKVTDFLIELVSKKLQDAEKKSDVKVKGLKLFGDGGFYDIYLQQKKWIELGKPKLANALGMNIFDFDDKNTHILFQLLDNWLNKNENRAKLLKQHNVIKKMKKDGKSPIEINMKQVEYGIQNSTTKDELKDNVNLLKELRSYYETQFDKLERKITKKIEDLVETYNKKLRSLD